MELKSPHKQRNRIRFVKDVCALRLCVRFAVASGCDRFILYTQILQRYGFGDGNPVIRRFSSALASEQAPLILTMPSALAVGQVLSMKAIILAGGLGSRLGEETDTKPKPMVNIGERPILWHIMKTYSQHGVNDFVVCLGYKGYLIKEYFANYFLHTSDVTFDVAKNSMEVHRNDAEPWRVTLVETGSDTMTGGRLKRVGRYVAGEDAFCLTYGDGVANVDIQRLIAFHKHHGKAATLTGVRPPGRFGALTLNGNAIESFEEKPVGDGAWINGGYFVLSPKVIDLIADDATVWEQEPLRALAATGQLEAFLHDGYWQCMDTVRDRRVLEELWATGNAPWRIW